MPQLISTSLTTQLHVMPTLHKRKEKLQKEKQKGRKERKKPTNKERNKENKTKSPLNKIKPRPCTLMHRERERERNLKVSTDVICVYAHIRTLGVV